MFGLPFSGVVNLVQTLGALGGMWMTQHGIATSDQTTAIGGGLATAALVIFNWINHNQAVASSQAQAAPAQASVAAHAAA